MIPDQRAGRSARRGAFAVTRTRLLAGTALVVFVGVVRLTAATVGSAEVSGDIARTQNVTDSAHMHYIREVGSSLLDEGKATGGLPGKVSALFNVGANVSATFTIRARGGSISGHGSGKLHGAGVYASFGGTMTVTHGTGRYAHAHGHGGFYGVLDRHNYSATIQTTGTLSY